MGDVLRFYVEWAGEAAHGVVAMKEGSGACVPMAEDPEEDLNLDGGVVVPVDGGEHHVTPRVLQYGVDGAGADVWFRGSEPHARRRTCSAL